MRLHELPQSSANVSSSVLSSQAFTQELTKARTLRSRTGAVTIVSAVGAAALAINESNTLGDMFVKKIGAFIEDGTSMLPNFPGRTHKLMRDRSSPVLGCGTLMMCEMALSAVSEKDNGLGYSNCYEGLEQSPDLLQRAQGEPDTTGTAVSCLAASCGKYFHLSGTRYFWCPVPTRCPNRPSLRPRRGLPAKQTSKTHRTRCVAILNARPLSTCNRFHFSTRRIST